MTTRGCGSNLNHQGALLFTHSHAIRAGQNRALRERRIRKALETPPMGLLAGLWILIDPGLVLDVLGTIGVPTAQQGAHVLDSGGQPLNM